MQRGNGGLPASNPTADPQAALHFCQHLAALLAAQSPDNGSDPPGVDGVPIV